MRENGLQISSEVDCTCLQASRGQDETDSDDETYPRGARRLAVRPSVAAPQGSARRKRLTRAEGQDPKHRGEEFEEDAPKSGSLSSIIANTAVAVEGLRKVSATHHMTPKQ